MQYYIITAACGHVGRGKYISVDFPVTASSVKEATKICRNIPRVKHGHKNAIIKVKTVSYFEYRDQVFSNKENPFLTSKNKKECLMAGFCYDCVEDMDNLKRSTNWKPRNDKQYESMKQRKHCKNNMAMYNDKLNRKEISYEIGFAV